MPRIMTGFGTHSEAIQMTPVLCEPERHPEQIESIVCTSGQHRQMLDRAPRPLGIKPDVGERTCEKMSRTANPYGDGRAAERIAGILLQEERNARPRAEKLLATPLSTPSGSSS